MRTPAAAWLAACLLATSLVAGCRDPSTAEICSALEAAHPGLTLERDEGFHLGRLSMAVVHAISRAALDRSDEDEATTLALVSAIHSIDMGTYRVRGLAKGATLQLPDSLARALDRHGWRTAVRERDAGEVTWVLSREQEGTVRSLYVVSFDGDELELVHLEGQLDRVLAAAVADHPQETTRALRDELD